MASDGTLKFDTSLDTGGLQSGMGKVASVAQQALGVFTGQMMTRAVDALANLGRSALDSVGQLEQNVGGVETLFGDAADAVIASADRAYQTAGMSANDYMSTVTSFSASLLQSLGGNTEEAAKVADMAIIDMADNANKMGTSMDMIQNAYQGFAKQNYTMLDNLKLGYGGTKTEMERLLADAEKLTGVKYDINNLNDVYQAIHAVQEEMGITGTTAKEAASTLEGSMASAKAAWDNFMNGSGDADQLADAFATAADNIVKNLAEIIPRFAETLPALGGAIIAQIPGLVAAIVPAVLSAGQSVLKQLQDAVLDFDFAGTADKVVQMITGFIEGDGLGSLLDTLATIFTGIVNGISSMLPSLLPALIELISYVVTSLLDQLPAILDCALELILGLAQGILAALPVLIEALPEVISSIVEFLISAVPQIIDAGIELLMALVDALPVIIDALVDALPQIIKATVTALIAAAPQIAKAGIKLLGALIEAIPVIVVELAEAVPDIVAAIIDVLAELPGLIGEVFAEIVTDLVEWGQQMLSNASMAMSNMLSQVNSIIQELPGKIWTHLVNTVNKVIAWGQQMVSNASTAASNMLSKVSGIIQELPGKIWTHLVNTVNKVVAWGQQMVSNASTAASNMLSKVSSTLQQLPGKVWDYLSQAALKVVTWGTQLAQKGAAAATQLFNSIVNGLSSLPSKMAEIGSNIVSGIWNGISSGWDWLTNKVSNLASSLLDAAKDALGINSPSKEFADEVGRWIMPGVGKGLDKSMPATLKDMKAKAGELVSAMRAEMSASVGQLSVGASHAAGLRMAGAGTTIYNDNRMEQSNTYNVPVATPSEVAKKQREALRNMVGGVK
uniref:Tail tape measure protein n=1 Tax=Siphoviridae sp. ct0hG5 TaxID=2826269 RepID=A0A8S5QKD3_9CAUD|nr:MAG TPA: tail tape measure protein [Siphoviridae sp. ct0hG5]